MGTHGPLLRLALDAMRTRFELVLAGGNEAALRAVGEEAMAEIAECERRLSFFDPGSAVSRINTLAHRQWVELDADTYELLELCATVHGKSGGAFDVTVGPLMRALFHGTHGPRDDELAAAAAVVGMDRVALDPRRQAVRFERPGMAIDLGSVGKGHALDLATAVLREHGVDCALLHGGTSTAVALGAPPGKPGWRIQLAGEGLPRAVVRDGALSVSGQHGRQVERGDTRLGHVLDPRRRARPTRAGRATLAAVLAPSAQEADAWSTALLANGAPLELVGFCRGSVPTDSLLTATFSPDSSFFENHDAQLSA